MLEAIASHDNLKRNFGESIWERHKTQLFHQLSTAWMMLETGGFIARSPRGERVFEVTQRGKEAAKSSDCSQVFKNVRLLPNDLLHPVVRTACWTDFLRGQYDDAVMKAFKRVEIAVRKAGGHSDIELGEALLGKAFDKDNGILTDQNYPDNERRGLSLLFQGAFATYRNATSHRHVSLGPAETAEILVLASHLLEIVDSRS